MSKNKVGGTSKPLEDMDEKVDAAQASLDAMMELETGKMDAVMKKSLIQSIIWPIVALFIYKMWPTEWYFWIPTVTASFCIASLMLIIIMRRKLKKQMAPT